jgi:hypothetical protein
MCVYMYRYTYIIYINITHTYTHTPFTEPLRRSPISASNFFFVFLFFFYLLQGHWDGAAAAYEAGEHAEDLACSWGVIHAVAHAPDTAGRLHQGQRGAWCSQCRHGDQPRVRRRASICPACSHASRRARPLLQGSTTCVPICMYTYVCMYVHTYYVLIKPPMPCITSSPLCLLRGFAS